MCHMALQICLSLPNHNSFKQIHIPKFSSSTILLSKSVTKPSSLSQKPNSQNKDTSILPSFPLIKRELHFSFLALIFNGFSPNMCTPMLAQHLALQRYTDSKEGFTLLRPSSWTQVDKAGATVLSEEASKGSNNVGDVVNPVRLTTLGEFGSPQFVADKLMQAEKRKESTKDAEVIGVAERSGQGGLQVYEFEYKVDSTRGGMKRIFTAAFVASKKLYLLNIAHSDKPDSPLDTHTRMMLEEVLHSFDVAPTT